MFRSLLALSDDYEVYWPGSPHQAGERPEKAASRAGMAGRAQLVDPIQQHILIAVNGDFRDLWKWPDCPPLSHSWPRLRL
jgi:hypothetical protein